MTTRSRSGSTKRAFVVWAFAFALCSLLFGCARHAPTLPGELLHGRAPLRVTDVDSPERLTDGVASIEGDPWLTDLTSVFRTPSATVEWDLGQPTRITAVYLEGDNNDAFFLEGSGDGQRYEPIFRARPIRGSGLRARHRRDLTATARYLKLTARGGDAAVSVGELLVFGPPPKVWPPRPLMAHGRRPSLPGELGSVVFGLVAAAALLLHRTTQPSWVRTLTWLLPAVLALSVLLDVLGAWPPKEPVIDALRAVSAFVAFAAVLRVALRPEGSDRRFVTGALASMAFVAMTTFYNMWQPQFFDVAHDRPTWVHTWDMRVYYPSAKYFHELGFDGLYVASVAAYLEDAPGADPSRVSQVALRDLRTYEMTTVAAVSDHVKSIKERFTPARWTAFKRDMRYFWETMGPNGYLGSLRDHGGNATPVWLLIAHLIFRGTVASERVLLLAALLDPLLLALFVVAAWRTFGRRTALVCLVIYGASTFPWYGSNWAGSVLRNDWMVLVGLGACALKKERWVLGGALLGGGAMIRAFPAVAVFFLIAPLLVSFLEGRNRPDPPRLRELVVAARPLWLTLAGAAACVALSFGLSSAVFGFDRSWVEWAHKISMHAIQPNVNHVGLRTLVQFDPSKTFRALDRLGQGGLWAADQRATFASRKGLYVLAISAYTLLAIAAARGCDLRKAALIGMMMVPIYFYPSNYYLHYVFLLPLLADDTSSPGQRKLWGLICCAMLLVCVSEYWGFEGVEVDERYAQWSVGLLVGYTLILLALVRDAWRSSTEQGSAGRPQFKQQSVPAVVLPPQPPK